MKARAVISTGSALIWAMVVGLPALVVAGPRTAIIAGGLTYLVGFVGTLLVLMFLAGAYRGAREE